MQENKVFENTAREQQAFERFRFMRRATEVLLQYFDKGFKNSEAISTILKMNGYNVSERQILDYWNFRHRDEEITNALEICLERLKRE